MTRPILFAAMLAAGLTATAAAPLEAQRSHIVWSDDDRSVIAVLDGSVQFTDDDADVASLGRGSSLVVEEHRRGGPVRHVEFREQGGTVTRRYTVDGVLRDDDADRRAWLARLLPEIVREHGFNASERVARILRTRGPAGVLAEIRRIRSDGVKRTYLQVLARTAELTPEQVAEAARVTGESIGSDGDRHSVLMVLLPQGRAEPAALVEIVRAAARIGSDGDKSRVLIAAASAPALDAPAVRDAWFRAAGTIGSDGDRTRALLAVLRRDTAGPDVSVAALQSARGIGSDGDRTRVLLAIDPVRLRDARVAEAYDAALEGISSDGDHRRAEQHARAARR